MLPTQGVKYNGKTYYKPGAYVDTVRAKGGAGGRLFGAVTPGAVADAVAAQYGVTLDKRKLTVSSDMKNEGDYGAEAKFYGGVSAKFTVSVVIDNG